MTKSLFTAAAEHDQELVLHAENSQGNQLLERNMKKDITIVVRLVTAFVLQLITVQFLIESYTPESK